MVIYFKNTLYMLYLINTLYMAKVVDRNGRVLLNANKENSIYYFRGKVALNVKASLKNVNMKNSL